MHPFILWLQNPQPHHHGAPGKCIPKTKKHGHSLMLNQSATPLLQTFTGSWPLSESSPTFLTQYSRLHDLGFFLSCLIFYHSSPTPASWSLPSSTLLRVPNHPVLLLLPHLSSVSFLLPYFFGWKPNSHACHIPKASPTLCLYLYHLMPPAPLCGNCQYFVWVPRWPVSSSLADTVRSLPNSHSVLPIC